MFLSEHEIERESITEGIQKHETEYRTKYQNENVKKMEDDFADQKLKQSELLLKIVDGDNSKNGNRHRHQNRGGGGGRGRGNRGFQN